MSRTPLTVEERGRTSWLATHRRARRSVSMTRPSPMSPTEIAKAGSGRDPSEPRGQSDGPRAGRPAAPPPSPRVDSLRRRNADEGLQPENVPAGGRLRPIVACRLNQGQGVSRVRFVIAGLLAVLLTGLAPGSPPASASEALAPLRISDDGHDLDRSRTSPTRHGNCSTASIARRPSSTSPTGRARASLRSRRWGSRSSRD